jgi:hypothetical protein
MRVIADDHENWRASPLFRLMRLLAVLLFAVLMGYWVIFVFYTMERGITGGPQAVLVWYEHFGTQVQSGPNGTFYIRPWSAPRFLMQQSVVLAVTVGLWFAVKRAPGKA